MFGRGPGPRNAIGGQKPRSGEAYRYSVLEREKSWENGDFFPCSKRYLKTFKKYF